MPSTPSCAGSSSRRCSLAVPAAARCRCVWRAFELGGTDLGANPIEKIQDTLGQWGLRFLLITLAVTPLRDWFNAPWLVQLRRMLGLFAFFYVLLHFLTWLILDQGLYWSGILDDIAKRPFITIGFAALLLLIPLAVTSTNGMMRRLGRRWKTLHRLDLRDRAARHLALLLAGQGGRARAADLPRHRGGAARLARMEEPRAAAGTDDQ